MTDPFPAVRGPLTAQALPSVAWVVCGLALSLAWSTAAPVDFTRDVQPIFEAHCFDCHGEDTQKYGLRLDTVHGILRGSDSGEPLFLRGSSADSLVIRMVTSTDAKHQMPPKGERVPEAEIARLRAWIDAGAAMPGEKEAAAQLQLKTNHWSFQRVRNPEVPRSGDPFVRNAIDEFVLAKQREHGLTPSPPADRATLIRRLYFVMHGMPPTPEEVAAFVNDTRPDAYARLVDTVLASPRYGERWARHWMDVVRYADTNGFETNRPRPTAYHYRDWIVESFNADKPYDHFIREQIAGDSHGADAATGFLVAGLYDIVKSPDINLSLMQRQDELADMVNTTGTAFMGLTMGCARCHNHKYDPVLQKDYFAMQAVFAGVNHGERPIRQKTDPARETALAEARSKETAQSAALEALRRNAQALPGKGGDRPLRAAVNARLNEESFAPVETASVRFTIDACSASEPCLDELEVFDESGRNIALASAGASPSASGSLAGYPIHKLEHLNDGQYGNNRSWIANANTGWVRLDFPAPVRIHRVVWGRDRLEQFKDRVAVSYRIEVATGPDEWQRVASSDDRAPFNGTEDPLAFIARLSESDATEARRLQSALTETKNQIRALTGASTAWIGTFSQPQKTHRLYRGEPMQPREVVAPDVLSVLGTVSMAVDEAEQQRRVKFADWVARPDHPLTARVMVNRLWHYIFGRGIVATPSDFGVAGARPTHPELLDWLADEFVRGGWSVKHIQRLIVNSATFQQASTPRPEAAEADTDAHYLWRYPPRRVEAEAIRDAMLAVSGALDLSMGGPGFSLMDIVEENVMHYFAKDTFTPAEFRRMVYQFRIRQTTDSVFSSFDCPDGGTVMPKRSRSNTPLQALNLFNSSFVLQQADILANRLRTEAGESPETQVDRAFTLVYSRPPDDWERRESATFIRDQGLAAFCRALYNSSEFLFVF
ncbi:MAG: DUF1553 domain-containing protein [Verrucomicrobiales bacterium]